MSLHKHGCISQWFFLWFCIFDLARYGKPKGFFYLDHPNTLMKTIPEWSMASDHITISRTEISVQRGGHVEGNALLF